MDIWGPYLIQPLTVDLVFDLLLPFLSRSLTVYSPTSPSSSKVMSAPTKQKWLCLSACAPWVRFSLSRTIFMPFSFQLTAASLLSYTSDAPGFQEGLRARCSFHSPCTHSILCRPVVSTVHACVLSYSVVSDSFETPWTIVSQLSSIHGISRQEYWSELPFPTPGIFPTQGLKQCLLHLLHWQVNSLPLYHLGSLYLGLDGYNFNYQFMGLLSTSWQRCMHRTWHEVDVQQKLV